MPVTFTLDTETVTLREYEKGDNDILNNLMRFVITRTARVRTYVKNTRRRRSLSFVSVPRTDYNTLVDIVANAQGQAIAFTDIDESTADVYIRTRLSATHSGKMTNTPGACTSSDGIAYVNFQLEIIYA